MTTGQLLAGRRNVLDMMMPFVAMAVVPVAMCCGDDRCHTLGTTSPESRATRCRHLGSGGQIADSAGHFVAGANGYPNVLDIGFQVTFAIISVAIISGVLAGRVKFSAWLAFVVG